MGDQPGQFKCKSNVPETCIIRGYNYLMMEAERDFETLNF
jgi:hypothetical protein